MFDKMLNRKIASVDVNSAKDEVYFTFQDGHKQGFRVIGDCCSQSWIEHLEMPNDIVGATVLSVDELPMGVIEENTPEHEYLQAYQTRFSTDRGIITLEYRNSSNGYYGGYIVPVK